MYKDYYRLQSEPFNTHPNADTFYVSETHKEAWYYLLFGIDTEEPFLLLTGEFGMGKTLLCLRLMKVLKERGITRVEYIPTSNEGYSGILRRIATTLGISTTPEDEEILQDMIYDRFRSDTDRSKFYLIIDDAHELDTSILTKLKYLSNFNHDEFFPVIMIFLGHQSFLQDLRSPALSSLNQRIKRRYHLASFSLAETKEYIYFRLVKSGGAGIPAFPAETLQKIYEYSGGVPRLINNICDTCLLISASKQLISIPPWVVDEAKNLVEGSLSGTSPARKWAPEPEKEPPRPITFSADLPEVRAEQKPLFVSTVDAEPKEARAPIYFSADLPATPVEERRPLFSVPDTDVKEDGPSAVTFSADLPAAGHAAKPAPIPSAPEQTDYQQKAARIKEKASGRKIRKAITLVVVIILLILAASWLYEYFGGQRLIKGLFSGTAIAPPQQTAVQTESGSVVIPTEKITVPVPTLRDEKSDKPAGEAQVLTVPAGKSVSAPAEPVPPQAAGAVVQQPPRGEGDSPKSTETSISAPFSLRASSYQKQERALPEIARLKQMGLTPYLVKVNLGDLGVLWRIYIGFYPTEEEAKKVKASYKLANTTIHKTEYACQVGEFTNEADGIKIFERLKKSDYFPYAIQKGGSLFRVYLGAYEKRSEAEAMHRELQDKGINSLVAKR